MDALEIARRSFDAWNAHDPEAIIASSFAPDGLYRDPDVPEGLDPVTGTRMFTFLAWENVEAVRALRRSEPHCGAMQAFIGPKLATGGRTGVWAPGEPHGMWVRCGACGEMVEVENGDCRSCRTILPEAPAWL